MDGENERTIEIPSPPATHTKRADVWEVTDVDISAVQPQNKLIALTFDDAPTLKLDRLVAIFASFNERNPDCVATATVFCNGHLIHNTTKHALFSAHALGWELGNHGYFHSDCAKLPFAQLQAELQTTDKLLSAIDGKEKHLFRPPFGNFPDSAKAGMEVPLVYWCIDTLDWTGLPATDIERAVLSSVYDGAIVLLHDGYENTLQAVKRLLPALKEAGYQAVTVSQMAKAHGCALKNGNAYIRARKDKATV